MKLNEAINVLKSTGFNLKLNEAQFTDQIMRNAMEDEQYINADNYEEREQAIDDSNELGEYVDQVKEVLHQVENLRKLGIELIENPRFSELEPQDAATLCHLCSDSDKSCDAMYEEYYYYQK